MTSVFFGIDVAVVEVDVVASTVAGGAVGATVDGCVGEFLFSLSERD